eukprot:CAMPEP_0198234442 /NCGR_PEP_ID=MMETSP1446-20131203/463_1 /TAXON_ID=1461542 ORGANISM="Unidentified sp, Strain CCMP2111" /NCGR_SAMPLE_ID=MMETSP1446 /ASSEMBLY_ACC=CAM_ASM_001112 /LENGTH=203 /DNA_ID=CAMNT_0043915225 /DNA_START=339 /DNA_END=950 /DNA_ORIENTATION=-
MEQRPNVVIAATGSVATVKLPMLVESTRQWANVKVILSETARRFVSKEQLMANFGDEAEPSSPAGLGRIIYLEEDEWSTFKEIGDPILHIELGKWADALVIAPLSANSLAKMANGLCDTLLTSLFRAWDFTKPVVVAPAMNTRMWDNPVTAIHCQVLKERYRVVQVDPVVKALACKDVGMGAMAEPATIAQVVKKLVIGPQRE